VGKDTTYDAELAVLRKRFATNLRAIRTEQAGYAQEDLAHVARLHRTEIGLLERGKRDPRLSTLLLLAEALGVTLDDLARDTEPPQHRQQSPTAMRGLRAQP
jgi:transcriptional regulator with XRE-family HTH domain